MGPSGAGKSTLVNVLSGRLTPSAGVLKVNGLLQPITPFRNVIGFVPQDDVMLRMLTVEEVVQHSADTRLPADWSSARRSALVDEVIDVLGLKRVRKSIIGGLDGSGARRGISGGERKVHPVNLLSRRIIHHVTHTAARSASISPWNWCQTRRSSSSTSPRLVSMRPALRRSCSTSPRSLA